MRKTCRHHARRRRQRFRHGADIALVGNPNTGKSCLFNSLTGMGAITSNYPGTTVDIFEGKSNFNGKPVRVVDLPGIYSLGGGSEDEIVAKDYIIRKKPAAIINIIDATLLERNLYLTLQLLELEKPTIVALNFYEELEDKGIMIDHEKLATVLGVPVVPIDALRGAGISELANKAAEIMDKGFEPDSKANRALRKRIRNIATKESGNLVEKYNILSTEIAKERHAQAAAISKKVVHKKVSKRSIKERLDRFTTEPLTGLISMAIVLAIIFSSLFYLGGYLSGVFGDIFENIVVDALAPLIARIPNMLLQTVLTWSLDGINAAVQIALPYIAVFYILLAFLEDTGYLPRMAYLLDRVMHKLHLHGKAIVPMMLGFGCSVPAVLSTRILPTKKERIVTATMVCMIPCSARTAVIIGAVGRFIGAGYALLLYAIVLVLMLAVGFILGRVIPGESTGLILELPEYRLPSLKNVLLKTWIRLKDFFYIAFPLIIAGSVALGILKVYGLLEPIAQPFEPIISRWLMLPAVAGITLIFGILRKELALEMLVVLGGSAMLLDFMTPIQIFVFALVITLYIPCIGTFAALRHEFGTKTSTAIAVFTIVLAVIAGGLAARFLGVLF